MTTIEEKCPVCGGDVERVEIQSNALGGGRMQRREPTVAYKCLSHPSIGHMPPNWRPVEPTDD